MVLFGKRLQGNGIVVKIVLGCQRGLDVSLCEFQLEQLEKVPPEDWVRQRLIQLELSHKHHDGHPVLLNNYICRFPASLSAYLKTDRRWSRRMSFHRTNPIPFGHPISAASDARRPLCPSIPNTTRTSKKKHLEHCCSPGSSPASQTFVSISGPSQVPPSCGSGINGRKGANRVCKMKRCGIKRTK